MGKLKLKETYQLKSVSAIASDQAERDFWDKLKNKNEFDVDLFHTAYDMVIGCFEDFDGMFADDGKLMEKKSYGVIRKFYLSDKKGNFNKALMKLWEAQYGNNVYGEPPHFTGEGDDDNDRIQDTIDRYSSEYGITEQIGMIHMLRKLALTTRYPEGVAKMLLANKKMIDSDTTDSPTTYQIFFESKGKVYVDVWSWGHSLTETAYIMPSHGSKLNVNIAAVDFSQTGGDFVPMTILGCIVNVGYNGDNGFSYRSWVGNDPKAVKYIAPRDSDGTPVKIINESDISGELAKYFIPGLSDYAIIG